MTDGLNRAAARCEGAAVLRIRTADADEQAERLRQWNQVYEQITPGRYAGTLTEVWLDDLQLFRETSNRSVRQAGGPIMGRRAFGIPLAMEGPSRFAGKSVDEQTVLTVDREDELDFVTARSLDIAGITVPIDALDAFSMQVDGVPAEEWLRGRRLLRAAPGRLDAFRRFLGSVFETVEKDEVVLHRQATRFLRQAILGHLLHALDSAEVESQWIGSYENRRQVVDRARAYVLEHLDAPVTVADLCQVLHISRRTLQTCFSEVLDTNPIHYLRAVRLAGARRSLRAAGKGESVQDIAARWGFWHLSHFAADYRRMFGELPSETMRASR